MKHVNFIGSPDVDIRAKSYEVPFRSRSETSVLQQNVPHLNSTSNVESSISFLNYFDSRISQTNNQKIRYQTNDTSIIVKEKVVGLESCIKEILRREPAHPITGFSTSICPLSHVPITFPCRGVNCNHSQCFDLRQFLLINEEESQRNCPICHQHLSYDDLRFDPCFIANSSSSVTSQSLASSSIRVISPQTLFTGYDLDPNSESFPTI